MILNVLLQMRQTDSMIEGVHFITESFLETELKSGTIQGANEDHMTAKNISTES